MIGQLQTETASIKYNGGFGKNWEIRTQFYQLQHSLEQLLHQVFDGGFRTRRSLF
jgi:hypothetical protein